ncbi:hypothetical protein [Bradyrhizobium sp. dw_78]|uniref:hypothetical protein n=1 Tax=Bradyrhizobium sp. dw_78 TaxID=2719793 RepID=UPI001BD25D6C|nr:hypothetical protein [Bradyrhizobium sp. dw_78]
MIAVVIEPALLAVPPVANSEDEVESIIDRLATWSAYAVRGSVLKVAQMTETAEILGETNCFPSGPNVHSLLEMYNLNQVYTPNEVTRLINTIIERAILVKHLTGFEVQACETEDIHVEEFQDPRLAASSANAFATVGSGINTEGVFLATASPGDGATRRFRGTVKGIDLDPSAELAIEIPFVVDSEVPIAQGPSCVYEAISSSNLWDKAQEAIDIHSAIALKMLEISNASRGGLQLDQLPEFCIGSGFFESLSACQAGPESRFGDTVLESCARVVLGTPKSSLDPFMKGARSKSTDQWERKRDSALAFRTHVTKSREALRLIFWRTTNGLIEFANVAVHDDLTLLEGEAATVVGRSW